MRYVWRLDPFLHTYGCYVVVGARVNGKPFLKTRFVHDVGNHRTFSKFIKEEENLGEMGYQIAKAIMEIGKDIKNLNKLSEKTNE